MVFPVPSAAPEILPAGAMAVVQVNDVPVTLLVNAIEVVPPEQNDCEAGVAVIAGEGFTVIVKVFTEPSQVMPPFVKCGVTVIVATTCAIPELVAVKDAMSPVPLAASPMEVLLLIQV